MKKQNKIQSVSITENGTVVKVYSTDGFVYVSKFNIEKGIKSHSILKFKGPGPGRSVIPAGKAYGKAIGMLHLVDLLAAFNKNKSKEIKNLIGISVLSFYNKIMKRTTIGKVFSRTNTKYKKLLINSDKASAYKVKNSTKKTKVEIKKPPFKKPSKLK